MRFIFSGKNMSVSERLKEQAEKKIGRMKRVLPENCEITVRFSQQGVPHKVEVTVPLKKRVLRAESSTTDMYASLDQVADALERQMVKYKQRLKGRSRRDSASNEEFMSAFPEDEDILDDQEGGAVIQRTKSIALKPMDPEEAVMEMELLGFGFYVFHNSDTDEVNVVYRRNNKTYGLIEPQR